MDVASELATELHVAVATTTGAEETAEASAGDVQVDAKMRTVVFRGKRIRFGGEEAWRAFRDLGARTMVPMHWGCFDLTDEPADLAPKVLEEVLAREGGGRARVRTLAVGERWRLDPPVPNP